MHTAKLGLQRGLVCVVELHIEVGVQRQFGRLQRTRRHSGEAVCQLDTLLHQIVMGHHPGGQAELDGLLQG